MKMDKNVTSKELRLLFKLADKLALEAGKTLQKFYKKRDRLTIQVKEAQGLVSEADVTAEKQIIKGIHAHYPDHLILAEESSYLDGKMDFETYRKAPWTWIIDPLDGTTNFLHGLEYYAVCIGVAHYGKPVIGVVYRPEAQEKFMAIEGEGAWYQLGRKSKKKLDSRTNERSLQEGMFATGFSTEKGIVQEKEFIRFKKILESCHAVRRLGSAALDMCYVAQGIFDGFWEQGLAPWDVAAASVICQESGVKITDFDGYDFHPFQKSIMVSRPPMYQRLREMMANEV